MNGKRLIVFACALLAVGIVTSWPSGAAEPVGAKSKLAEFSALKSRAVELGRDVNRTEWRQLLGDFDAWAKRYGADTQTQSVASAAQSGSGSPMPSKPCKPYFQNTPGFFCVLDPRLSDEFTCYYKCTKY